MKTRVYLDYNATTPVCEPAKLAIIQALSQYGNPSSLHQSGREVKVLLEEAREAIGHFFGARQEQIIFTSSGSEGNNQALKHVLFHSILTKTPAHIITSTVEHSSVRVCCDTLESLGVQISRVGVNADGYVSIDEIVSALRPNTRLISIQLANNEVGTLQPISELVEACKDHPCLIHTDAVQAAGKLPLNMQELGVDLATFSSHKLYAPKGCGALYVKNHKQLSSLISGSSHERKLRAGTEAIPSILAFSAALQYLDTSFDFTTLRQDLVNNLRTHLPGVVIHTPLEKSIANTLSIGFDGLDAHAIAMNLDLDGFEVSTGSACSVGSIEPSVVLEAMGVSTSLNKGSLRISLGLQTTQKELYDFVLSLQAIVHRMQNL
jgi:cysteine desulfurase